MILLSIHDGHNASAAICKDGEIVSCVSEERINRKKFFWGWPEKSIEFVCGDTGIKLKDIDVICVSHLATRPYAIRKLNSSETYNLLKPKIFLGNIYNILQSWKKEQAVRNFRRKNCSKAKLFFCDHHIAHAASAYYCSGQTDALVVTCDNLGDSYSHTAHSIKGGKWNKLTSGDSRESLGAFYGAITEGLGFKPNQHEGKIVGLAAYASPDVLIQRMRDKCISRKEDLHFSRSPYNAIVSEIKAMLNEGYSKEEVSSAAQSLLEDLMVGHVKKLLSIQSHSSICLAGGVFANVKLNQRIKDIDGVNNIFIQPAMGDEGLVLGSAWCYLASIGENIKDNKLRDVYFGTHYKNEEIEHIILNKGYRAEKNVPLLEIAGKISRGMIIGVFDGRMEFGPRALGARSIVADPRNKDVNDVLNKRLKRSEFMPFAPSVLIDYADQFFTNIGPAMHTAEFMTMTFDVKKELVDKVPAVVHIDNTARPQFVRKDRNENYYHLIEAFYSVTGIPLVMNTSFNMHEEPIVSSPEDALRSLEVGAVDAILFNNSIFVTK